MSHALACPQCGHMGSRVIDSRPREIGLASQSIPAMRRRRECTKCQHRYTTFELHAGDVREFERLWGALGVLREAIPERES